MSTITCCYIARAPLTVAGRDWRGGDSFWATADEIEIHLASGAAEPWPPHATALVEQPAAAPSAEDEPTGEAPPDEPIAEEPIVAEPVAEPVAETLAAPAPTPRRARKKPTAAA